MQLRVRAALITPASGASPTASLVAATATTLLACGNRGNGSGNGSSGAVAIPRGAEPPANVTVGGGQPAPPAEKDDAVIRSAVSTRKSLRNARRRNLVGANSVRNEKQRVPTEGGMLEGGGDTENRGDVGEVVDMNARAEDEHEADGPEKEEQEKESGHGETEEGESQGKGQEEMAEEREHVVGETEGAAEEMEDVSEEKQDASEEKQDASEEKEDVSGAKEDVSVSEEKEDVSEERIDMSEEKGGMPEEEEEESISEEKEDVSEETEDLSGKRMTKGATLNAAVSIGLDTTMPKDGEPLDDPVRPPFLPAGTRVVLKEAPRSAPRCMARKVLLDGRKLVGKKVRHGASVSPPAEEERTRS